MFRSPASISDRDSSGAFSFSTGCMRDTKGSFVAFYGPFTPRLTRFAWSVKGSGGALKKLHEMLLTLT
jgi:hypothetical protein